MDKYNQNIDNPYDNFNKNVIKTPKPTSLKKTNPKIIALIGLLVLGLLSLIISFISQNNFPNFNNNSNSNQKLPYYTETIPPDNNNPWLTELDLILTNLNQEIPIPIISIEENLTF